MSLLDDLEQQAQARKASAEDVQAAKLARTEFFKAQIEPAMQALGEYLEKLISNLRTLAPANPWPYTVPGYGEVIGYSDHDYEIKQTAQSDAREMVLTFGCTIAQEQSPLVEVEGVKIKALAGTFNRFHLGGVMMEPKKDSNGEVISAKFRARGRVALCATFNASADSAMLAMRFDNFDTFGSVRKTVSIGQLGEALFDDIGRHLTREENSLFRETLPNDYREKLRSSVERDQIKKRWDAKIDGRRKSDLDVLKKQHGSGASLLGRLRTLVKKDR